MFDFLKRTTWVAADAAALAQVGPAAIALAEAEGLGAHARSIAVRLAGNQQAATQRVGTDWEPFLTLPCPALMFRPRNQPFLNEA